MPLKFLNHLVIEYCLFYLSLIKLYLFPFSWWCTLNLLPNLLQLNFNPPTQCDVTLIRTIPRVNAVRYPLIQWRHIMSRLTNSAETGVTQTIVELTPTIVDILTMVDCIHPLMRACSCMTCLELNRPLTRISCILQHNVLNNTWRSFITITTMR